MSGQGFGGATGTVTPVAFGRPTGDSAGQRTERRGPARPITTALVCMPFAALRSPSIQVGLLASIVERAGHVARPMHMHLEFAAALQDRLGAHAVQFYDDLVSHRFQLGDWFFAEEAFGDDAPPAEWLLDDMIAEGVHLRSGLAPDAYRSALLDIRRTIVPRYLDAALSDGDWNEVEVVGFTSTFQQTVASFALARRLKAARPDIVTLFGGANFDGSMGVAWLEGVPVADAAIAGEADVALPAFLDALASGDDPLLVPGVIARREGRVLMCPPEPPASLTNQPVPDYDDFFTRLDALELFPRQDVSVFYESARGCWWGARRHCTFCGLNGTTMTFRSRPAEMVLQELTSQALRHRVLTFFAVDNIIDTSYFDTLLPALASSGRPFHLFYEVKADLEPEQLDLLVRAGVDLVQPGIESLSSSVLALMRKGTRAAWNVNLLRWSAHLGLDVTWNVLWGFPGERADDVAQQVHDVGLLAHLQPPAGGGRLWMERFSPLFDERDPERSVVRPNRNYGYTVPATVDMERAAYFFDYELDDALDDSVYQPLHTAIAHWIALHEADCLPFLGVSDEGDHLLVLDGREPGSVVSTVLEGLHADVHRACSRAARLPEQVAKALDVEVAQVSAALDDLVEARLVFRDRRLHVALALPTDPPEVVGRRRAPHAARVSAVLTTAKQSGQRRLRASSYG